MIAYVVLIALTALILIILCSVAQESFTTRQSKAQSIYNWFAGKRVQDLTYNDYKQSMGGQSNIVEYEDVLRLAHAGKLSLGAVAAAVN